MRNIRIGGILGSVNGNREFVNYDNSIVCDIKKGRNFLFVYLYSEILKSEGKFYLRPKNEDGLKQLYSIHLNKDNIINANTNFLLSLI